MTAGCKGWASKVIGAAKGDRLLVLGMAVPFVLLMGSQITGRAAHEWLGLALFCMALAHQYPT